MSTAVKSGAMSLLAGLAATAPAKKGKADKPELQDAALGESIEAFIKHQAAMESAEALMQAAKGQLTARAREHRYEFCATQGKVISSTSLCAGPGKPKLTFTMQNRYSAVPGEHVPALQDAFGEKYPLYFKSAFELKLNETSANDEAVLTELIEKVGQEFLAKHFAIKQVVKVQEALHNAITVQSDVRAVAQPFLDQEIIKPASPSLKVA